MSKDLATTNTSQKQTPAPSSTSEAAQKELQALDTKLRRLSDKLIQASPYILTVPSDRPYNLDKRLADDWKRGTPFDYDEERLQYLSFLPEWDQGLITPVGAWDNEKGGMDNLSQSQSGRSSAGTPTVGAKKSKISLSDYKKKTAGQPVAPSVKRDGEDRKHANGASSADKASAPASTTQRQKRPRDENVKPGSSRESQPSQGAPSSKKPKISPSPSPAAGKTGERDSSPLELPPWLSPTLPPQIREALAKIEPLASSSRKESEKPKSQETREISNKPRAAVKDKASLPSKPNGSLKPQIQDQRYDKTPIHSASTSINKITKPHDKVVIKRTTEPVHKSVLKLKIPKSIRSRYERLLRTPQARQKSEASKAPKTDSREPVAKSIERETGKGTSKISLASSGEKRLREHDGPEGSGPPQKRPRAPSNLDLASKPSTPVPPAFRSPVISHHGSAQKVKSSTPSISHPEEVSTPQGAIRNGTPLAPDSVDRSSRDKVQSSNLSKEQPSKLQGNISFLHRTQLAHFNQGRKLKHNCDSELNSDKDATHPRKKAIALGMESILCFMISYTIRDEMNRLTRPNPREATWATIFAYIGKTKHIVENYPHLRGLCCQLEAVCHIATYNAELERSQQHPSHPAPPNVLINHTKLARDLFIEGATELSVDDLQHSFPNSWRNKAKAPIAQPGFKFDMKIEGKFYLPMTSITTTLEAVRAGKSILAEWCRMEGVQWEASIGTKLPSRDDGRAKAESEDRRPKRAHD
ncbi:MAG: hypothetical protein MMC23_008026 [Stictis urceolatum]|nr:hypothetical protein [Stictis urceolata]